jgi:hypothetical protein
MSDAIKFTERVRDKRFNAFNKANSSVKYTSTITTSFFTSKRNRSEYKVGTKIGIGGGLVSIKTIISTKCNTLSTVPYFYRYLGFIKILKKENPELVPFIFRSKSLIWRYLRKFNND